jgi:hypothetical protein
MNAKKPLVVKAIWDEDAQVWRRYQRRCSGLGYGSAVTGYFGEEAQGHDS